MDYKDFEKTMKDIKHKAELKHIQYSTEIREKQENPPNQKWYEKFFKNATGINTYKWKTIKIILFILLLFFIGSKILEQLQ